MTASEAIYLQEAPARFLNADWVRLVAIKGSEADALKAISNPEPGLIVFYRREAMADGGSPAGAQADEQITQLVEKMIADFQALGASGHIAADGISSGTQLRQVIPPELWPDLKMNFQAGTATANDGQFSYRHVRLSRPKPADIETDLPTRLAAWLKQRRSETGEEPKKVLAQAACEEFGGNFKERAFNSAYKKVYERPRGRPRRSDK